MQQQMHTFIRIHTIPYILNMDAKCTGSLTGRVSIVTGASRGIGKGIALHLAEQGSKVYITGRTLDSIDNKPLAGSLRETEREIQSRGGVCVPVQCDHSQYSETERLFKLVADENKGRLDILVNNAFSGNNIMLKERGNPFWEQPISMWDDINNVGLRNHYLSSVNGARLMVPRMDGLIVNISSRGATMYEFNPAYGIGKAGVDRMAADCALELKKYNVAFVSVWPGPVCSDSVLASLQEAELRGEDMKECKAIFNRAETPEFIGKCVAALAKDPFVMEKTGKVLKTYELGEEYEITDQDGHTPIKDFGVALQEFVNALQ